MTPKDFVHLHVHSPYSFLGAGSSLNALVQRAAELGMDSLAITDHANMSAAVQFNKAASSLGLKPIHGAEITLDDGSHLTLLARTRTGYANICKLITISLKASDRFDLAAIAQHKEGVYVLSGCRRGRIPALILDGRKQEALSTAEGFKAALGDNFAIEMQNNLLPYCSHLNDHLYDMATYLGLPCIGTSNAHYATKQDFRLYDALSCVRTHSVLDDVNDSRMLNAEDYLFSSDEASSRFRAYDGVLRNTRTLSDACENSLVLEEPMFPTFSDLPPGLSAQEFLKQLVYAGATSRYGQLTNDMERRLEHELNVIISLSFEDYFLFVWDVTRYARERGFRFAGRGSAADSAVAYCLGITNVDSIGRGLLFERFMSMERAQRPDIDIDFDARFRDEVLDYIYGKYGEDRVAMVCTFSRYHARSAIRDIGKVLSLGALEIDTLAKRFPYLKASGIRDAIQTLPELRDSSIPLERYEMLFDICERLAGFPRHIGTHLGGVVVCRNPLTHISPLQISAKGVVICQFDKDYIEDLGLVKLDLLCLKTMSAVEDASIMIRAKEPAFEYDRIPLDDDSTYKTLRSGNTIGAFQLESPAQRALQARLGADNIEDIVASVALIRPGPIEGNMVEPFIARRQGREKADYLHPSLKPILEKTYGVVLFQEQVIQIATTIAGFTPGEADRLRRVMTHARSRDDMESIGHDFIEKAIAGGIERPVAVTVFSYIMGYAGYGFCEAHAAAFSDTAFKTAYLVTHHPAEFYAAILNNEPMGYYPPHTICIEAKRRGIAVLGPDVNRSLARYSVEGGSIRVGLKQIRALGIEAAEAVVCEREARGAFTSLDDVLARTRGILRKDALGAMVYAGSLDSLHANRRESVWRFVSEFGRAESGLLAKESTLKERSSDHSGSVSLRDFTPFELMSFEHQNLGFSVATHLMDHYSETLRQLGVSSSLELSEMPAGKWARVAGVLVRPHRPPTKSGKTVVFLSLEDRYGLSDVTVFESVYQRYGKLIFTQPALIVQGRVEKRGNGTCIIASGIREFPALKEAPIYPEAHSQA